MVSDGTLLMFGCAVSFLVVAGAYVFIRERLQERPLEAAQRDGPPRRTGREAA